MNYIVIDFEFNQAFDYPDGISSKVEKVCPFEIIQIGAIKLNDKYEEVGKFNILIKPNIYTRVHPYVQKITDLDRDILEDGHSFPEAIEKFKEFIGEEKFTLCTWGSCDIKELWKNLKYYNINFFSGKIKYINVQRLASRHLQRSCDIGLENATIIFDIERDKKFHDALNDAYYTSRIFQILRKIDYNIENFNLNKNVNIKKKKKELNTFDKIYNSLAK